jgi:hypothetical protein
VEKHEIPADICRPCMELSADACQWDVCFSAGKHRPHFAIVVARVSWCVLSRHGHTPWRP